jgi:hypothetical protein
MDVSDQSMEPLLPQPTTTGDRPFGRSGKASRAPLTGVLGGAVIRPSFYTAAPLRQLRQNRAHIYSDVSGIPG